MRGTTIARMSGTTSIARAARSAAPVVLVAAIAWPALAFGGVYPWAWGTLMVICAAFAVVRDRRKRLARRSGADGVRRRRGGRRRLQLVPLAPAILRTPRARRRRDSSSIRTSATCWLAAAGPVWHPLSIESAGDVAVPGVLRVDGRAVRRRDVAPGHDVPAFRADERDGDWDHARARRHPPGRRRRRRGCTASGPR